MTVTETRPGTATADESPVPERTTVGLAGVLGSGDHKVVGRLWVLSAVVGLLASGAAGALVSIERVDVSAVDALDTSWFAQLFSFHPIAGAFLFLLPLTIGVATAIVPLQVGASTVAFPRAAAAALWAQVVGAGILLGGYAADGGPFGGDAEGVELYLVGLAVVLAAQILAWICIATTVVTLRAPGLRLTRVPPFAWSALVAGLVWLLTLPVLAATTVLAFFALRYGVDLFGAVEGLYGQVAWAFGQPAIYAFGIVVLGVMAEVVPVFSATRHSQHRLALGLIGAYGVLSVGAWTLPGFASDPQPWLYELPWVAISLAIVVPVLGLIGLWADTARRGRRSLASPLLYGLAASLMLLVGVLAGAVQSIEPLETLVDGEGTSLYGTTWTTGVAHYIVLAATTALLGAITYWAPKLAGKVLAEGVSRVLAIALLAGTILLSFPDLVSGLLGQASRLPDGGVADNTSAIEALNLVSAIGGAVLVIAALGWVVVVLRGLASDGVPGDDPWRGHTLEWATTSPPPPGNFTSLPDIDSEAPLYDARHRAQAGEEPAESGEPAASDEREEAPA